MRIAVVSAPKTGNHWVKCLLGHTYDLRQLGGREKPARMNPGSVQRWVAKGRFADGAIMHQHTRFTPAMADALESAPARIVTVIRDPYDVFVSLYHWAQGKRDRPGNLRPARRRDVLVGRPLDDDLVLRYLADEFGTMLDRAAGWLESGRAIAVRYEELQEDPVRALSAVTSSIAAVPEATLAAAVSHCSADNMRATTRPGVVRTARVGDGILELGEAHLDVFRRHHADRIRRLGYEVR